MKNGGKLLEIGTKNNSAVASRNSGTASSSFPSEYNFN